MKAFLALVYFCGLALGNSINQFELNLISSSVQIIDATYGPANVTEKVQSLLNQGRNCFFATNQDYGDPQVNVVKTLTISWIKNGQNFTKSVVEHTNDGICFPVEQDQQNKENETLNNQTKDNQINETNQNVDQNDQTNYTSKNASSSYVADQDSQSKNLTLTPQQLIDRISQHLYKKTGYIDESVLYSQVNELIKYFVIIISGFIGNALLADRRLSSHSGKLIGWICLLQATCMNLQNQYVISCIVNLYKLFAASLYIFLYDQYTLEQLNVYAFFTQTATSVFLFQTTFVLFVMFVTCFTFDLYLTIVNPLYPPEKRFNRYLIASIMACIILYIYEYSQIKGKVRNFFVPADQFNQYLVDLFILYHDENLNKWVYFLVGPFVIQFVLFIVIIVKACSSLNGIGQEIRKQVIRKQAIFATVTLLCQFPYFKLPIKTLRKLIADIDNPIHDTLDDVQQLVFMCTQLICSIYFIFYIYSDPFIFKIIKKNYQLSRKFCNYKSKNDNFKKVKNKKQSQDKADKDMQQLFQASLSIEIIYTILNAVTQQLKNFDQGVIQKQKTRLSINLKNSEHDFFDIKIFRMDNQEFQNLHKLNNSNILTRQSSQILSNNSKNQIFIENSQQNYLNENEKKQFYRQNFSTIRLDRKVIVKQYAPKTFQKIRNLCGYQDEELIASLDPSANIKQIQNAGLGAGASGSFFFFSEDKKFIMKTMSSTEVGHMQRILQTYFEHILTQNSIMAKILGIFTIQMDKFSPISILIMENTMPNIQHFELQYVFDMKGSQINREVLKSLSVKDLLRNGPTGGKVLKDLDFLRLKNLKKFINLNNQDWLKINEFIKSDVEYLKQERFMDYSILMAIRKIQSNKKFDEKLKQTITQQIKSGDSQRFNQQIQGQDSYNLNQSFDIEKNQDLLTNNSTYFSRDGKWSYQISIIDYLQAFDQGKKMEVLAKRIFKNADPKKLSAVPPDPYAERFINFMKDEVFETPQKNQGDNQIEQIIKEIQQEIYLRIQNKFKEIFLKHQ